MMKTYIKLTFNSEGERPSEIVDLLHGLGFKPQKGEYDMVYDWGDKAELSDAIRFADQIHSALEGHNVLYSIETDTFEE